MMRMPVALALVAASVAIAAAQPSAPSAEQRAVARAHYEKAVNHFNAGEYAAAADEFLAVHAAVAQPALLYNAAQAYRLGGDGPKALENYRAFLKEAPEAKQRPDVEKHIKELEGKNAVVVKVVPDMSVPDKLVVPTKSATPTPAKTAAPTSASGGSDRLQAIAEVVKQNRAGFRACFDKWSKSHPGINGRVTLTFYLDPDGNLDQPSADEKGFVAPEVASCIEELSRTLHYPKSPSGKFTRFSYPFDFKAAR